MRRGHGVRWGRRRRRRRARFEKNVRTLARLGRDFHKLGLEMGATVAQLKRVDAAFKDLARAFRVRWGYEVR